MALRKRGGKWHYRFERDGRAYSGATDLDATKRNEIAAAAIEAEHRRAIVEGRRHRRNLAARRFSDAASEYLAWCDAEYRDHPSTARRIRVSFTSLGPHMGDAMVGSVGAAEIERYKARRIAEHQVRDVTLRHDLYALSGFFRWAIRMGYAAENPVRQVRIPSDKDAVRMNVLTADEERLYFGAAELDPLLHDFARLMLQQGMRPDELLTLSAAAVDLDAGTLRVVASKTSAGRRNLTLTAESRSILARRCVGLAPERRVFEVSASGLAKKHAAALTRSGVKCVLYDLRHTFATRMAQAGCDLATLAAILGHSSLRIVARYIHPTAQHQARAMRAYEASQRAPADSEVVQ